MKVKIWLGTLIGLLSLSTMLYGQTETKHFDKIILKKKEKKVFADRDSSSIILIDTLIMKDRASLQFYGKKDVKIVVRHAEIGNDVLISGQGAQNNASNFDLQFNFKKLGSLIVLARGHDANNGMRTDPNGDAGNVILTYDAQGIIPQSKDRKAKNYFKADVTPGGLRVTPNVEIPLIYSRMIMSSGRIMGVPQGQIYSGSPGREGKVTIKSN